MILMESVRATAVQRAIQTRKKRKKVPGERSARMKTLPTDQMMRNSKILSESPRSKWHISH